MTRSCQRIPVTCSRAFQQIEGRLGELGKGQENLGDKLDGIALAVTGNGNPKESLQSRVERLECSAATVHKCTDRFWRVLAVLASVISVAVAIVALVK